MQNKLMELVEQSSMKANVPKFEIGDTVDVHVRILEGEKERIQIFNGVVIARSGTKTREMFVVRRIVQGEGVERKFPLHSPRIADIVVKRSGKVRRAKLYYLRGLSGKAVRLKERFPASTATAAEAKAAKLERRAARAQRKADKIATKEANKAAAAAAASAPKPEPEATA
jgi:large subunit ribosomal protein L19